MNKIICILFLSITYSCNAQLKKINPSKVDSILINSYAYYDKETSSIFDTVQTTTIKLISTKKLSPKEGDILIQKLNSSKSYSSKRVLLSDFSIKVLFFVKGQITQYIVYSSLTKNITIFRGDSCVYKGLATPYLGNELNNLLKGK